MQIAHEEAKLGRLLFNARADGDAAAALRRAAESLARCYGRRCEEAGELRRLAAMCAASGPPAGRGGQS